jgi:hypothetical protein
MTIRTIIVMTHYIRSRNGPNIVGFMTNKATHSYLKFSSLIVTLGLLLLSVSCQPEKVKLDRTLASASFSHSSVSTQKCQNCHEQDRPAINNFGPDANAGLHGRGRDCMGCHQPDGPAAWLSLISFDHGSDLATCSKCHEYKRPQDPHPQDTDCISCHTYNVWKNVDNFDHPDSLTSCNLCHDDGSSAFALKKKGRPVAPHPQAGRDCIDCHSPAGWETLTTTFDHLPKPSSCEECHVGNKPTAPKRGRPALMASGAAHNPTGKCVGCHTPASWTDTIDIDHSGLTSCTACHSNQRPVAPHPAGGDCFTCHSFPAWYILKQYDHNPTPATCQDCHNGVNPSSINQKSRPPTPHPQGGVDCNQCHTYPLWKSVVGFNHSPSPPSCAGCHTGTNTIMPKLGRPVRPDHPPTGDCKGCHTFNNWADANVTSYTHVPAPTSCIGCHGTQPNTNLTYKGRPALPHPATGDCTTCHSFPSWTPPNQFDHNPEPASCNTCHEGNSPLALKQKGRPVLPHPQGPRDCVECHNYPSWKPPSGFDHNPVPATCAACHENKSPLAVKQRGRPVLPHPATRECNECHSETAWLPPLVFDHNPLPATCTACHAEKSSLALTQKGPPVSPHPFNRDCVDCHTFPNWETRSFPYDHNPSPITCATCHVGNNTVLPKLGRPSLVPRPGKPLHTQVGDCVNCHTFNDWNTVSSVDHSNLMGQVCSDCHSGTDIGGSKRGRPVTPHPTVGECSTCHTFPNWTNVANFSHTDVTSCNACHNNNPQGALMNRGRPALPHPQNNRDCVACHTYPLWKPPIAFDHNPLPATCNECHNARSPFAAKQKGRPFVPHPQNNRDCVACHTYSAGWKPPVTFDHNPLPSSCNTCHEGKDPNALKQKGRPVAPHPGGGRDCVACHTFPAWNPPVTFDHNPLPASCASCHTGTNTVLPKLGRPTRIDHPQTGDCSTCHTFNNWSNVANFDHVGVTNCNTCHENSRPIAPHPQGTDCIACHSNPSWVPVTTPFNHNPVPASCNACHTNDRPLLPHPQVGECNTCHTVAGYTPVAQFAHNPEPTSCQECHTGVDVGGNKRGRPALPHIQTGDCIQCHMYNPGQWTPLRAFTHVPRPANCGSCHESDRPTSGDYNYPATSLNRNSPKPNPSLLTLTPGLPTSKGIRHYDGRDCVSCHRTPAQGQNNWNNFSHGNPKQMKCLPCHYTAEDPRSANDYKVWNEHGPDSNFQVNLNNLGVCFNCHQETKSFDD